MRKQKLRIGQLIVVLALLMGTVLLPNQASVALAQDNDLFISISGPSRIAPGGNITYAFTVENLREAEIREFSFFSKIPANTTHVSGGTHDTNANHAVFSLASLPANKTESFSLVVKVGNSVANGTDILLDWQDIEATDWLVDDASGEYGRSDGVHTTVEAPGTVVAMLNRNGKNFDVTVDGFGFSNFSNSGHNSADDLLPADVFNLFGPSVCQKGDTAETCVLTTNADTWRKNTINALDGGHCDGMASGSMSLFTGQPLGGISSPGDIQSGASKTNDINFPGGTIENYITAQMSFQYTAEWGSQFIDKTPKEVVNFLTTEYKKTNPEAYEVSIFKRNNPKDGHSIVATGIEKINDDEMRILVYDNNFPNKREFITVDMKANTWRYETAATPGETPDVYEGDANTFTLSLMANSFRTYRADYFQCVACKTQKGSATVRAAGVDQAGDRIEVQYNGEGAYLVVNDEGQKTGDDPESLTFVDEIPDTQIREHIGGLGLAVPPRIIFPVSETDDTFYTVIVHGKTITNPTSGSLNITGPGFVIGVNDIELDAGEQFEFTFSPDGDHISFDATEDIVAPELYIAHENLGEGDPSVIFDIEGVSMVAGEKVTLDLDPELEQVYFNHSGPEAENFIVDMQLVFPDGDIHDHNEAISLPAGANAAFVDFGGWDGLLNPPTYFDGVLQNPSVNHRLKLESSNGSYDPTPQDNAPAGVYTIEATYTNVTEVQLSDLYFTVANLTGSNVLLNADGSPAGNNARISVPAAALGEDELLHVNESFTISFEIGLASPPDASDFMVNANGVPHDWTHEAPALEGEANNEAFGFTIEASTATTIFLPLLAQ